MTFLQVAKVLNRRLDSWEETSFQNARKVATAFSVAFFVFPGSFSSIRFCISYLDRLENCCLFTSGSIFELQTSERYYPQKPDLSNTVTSCEKVFSTFENSVAVTFMP